MDWGSWDDVVVGAAGLIGTAVAGPVGGAAVSGLIGGAIAVTQGASFEEAVTTAAMDAAAGAIPGRQAMSWITSRTTSAIATRVGSGIATGVGSGLANRFLGYQPESGGSAVATVPVVPVYLTA